MKKGVGEEADSQTTVWAVVALLCPLWAVFWVWLAFSFD